jgi:hypothetical protein
LNIAITYDAARGRMVLVGGIPSPGTTDGLQHWEWDGSSWTQITSVPPPQISLYGSVYDPIRKRVMIWSSDATWEYDGHRWLRVLTDQSPTVDASVTARFDTAHHEIFLYSGFGHPEAWAFTRSADNPHEVCTTEIDADHDLLAGCADPDCAAICDPICADIAVCDSSLPHCGDGVCTGQENCRNCGTDCGACASRCGDFKCDINEGCTSCRSDCPTQCP